MIIYRLEGRGGGAARILGGSLWKDSEGDHSNLPTWKMKTWGDRESHLMLLGETTSVK